MTKTALISGVSGQDGAYLARMLIEKGMSVVGASRDAQGSNFYNLERLGIKDKISTVSMMPEDFRSVLVAFSECQPDEIYFLAGQSSVGLSFSHPAETIQSILLGTLNALEAVRMLDKQPRIYFAGSGEVFGDTSAGAACETTNFQPKSPYAVAKASAFWLVDNYRDAYGVFACTGILFNHESSLRPERFVTKKIISAAARIAAGSKEVLELGRLDISRDWGWAPEYVEAMWLMLQQDHPEDFVISTGLASSLESFVSEAFASHRMNWKDHVKQNKALMRPADALLSYGDSSKAWNKLGWKAQSSMTDVVRMMVENKL